MTSQVSKKSARWAFPASVRDRVVQGALKHVLEPIFEKCLYLNSYGLRPELSCKDALRTGEQLLKNGYEVVVDADMGQHQSSSSFLWCWFKRHINRRRFRRILRKRGTDKCYQDHQRWPNAYFNNLGYFALEAAHRHGLQSLRLTYYPDSYMRDICTYGSEGRGAQANAPSLPLSMNRASSPSFFSH